MSVFGPPPTDDDIEVIIPYSANVHETEQGWPSGEILDWFHEHKVDIINNKECGVSWLAARRLDEFWFYFRDPELAMLFKLAWFPQ